jgi:UDP-perosamine 4-acetyltransferase
MQKLLIFGAGGHAKVSISVALNLGFTELTVFGLDDDSSTILGFPVLSESPNLSDFSPTSSNLAFVAIGDNLQRKNKTRELLEKGFKMTSLISPLAIVHEEAQIGPGTLIMPGSVINVGSRVGVGVVVNTGAIIDHDCLIGDFSHIAPNCTLTGSCTIGDLAMVGAGSTLLPGTEIGREAVVGAGSVVTKNVGDSGRVVGIPAKQI